MTENQVARERVRRKRAARALIYSWCRFTPMQYVLPDTACEPGDVLVEVTLRVRAADIDRELAARGQS